MRSMTARRAPAGVLAAFGLVLATVSMAGANTETAVFAGGCFWCVESDFDQVDGVVATTSGYTGGHLKDPTYKSVTAGRSGHYEAVKIDFRPDEVTFRELADKFFRSVDPTDDGGQFCDRGDSYRTAIFVMDERQREAAEAARAEAELALGMTIVTPVIEAATFYPAEDYHQDYYLGENRVITRFGIIRQADAYKRYRKGCGRDERVRQLWGDQAAFAH